MLRIFQNELLDKRKFIITLELVPGRESAGRSVATVIGIARDSYADGRVAAVSITDNPGGNPSLSPDVIGHEIFETGMDVIVHFTCRDLNRAGIESRALQLALMGMKNLLALTGDYTGKGFGGQGAPVFDLDSVTLLMILRQLGLRMNAAGDPDVFFSGCAVSPFKKTAAECFAQYAKLCRKVASGAQFVITQLGYDARKFLELIGMLNTIGLDIPVLGSAYVLTPRAAELMNRGQIPGAVVTDKLLDQVRSEWRNPVDGRRLAVDRTARLGAVLKGFGYRGMHIGGIHRDFDLARRILDRMQEIEHQWQAFLTDFDYPIEGGFYAFAPDYKGGVSEPAFAGEGVPLKFFDKLHLHLMESLHRRFFSFESRLSPLYENICRRIDARAGVRRWVDGVEKITKRLLLDCLQCGDCGIQHLAFLCPESQCPKHIRNGACGGSQNSRCEVYPDRLCVWVRAYRRFASLGETDKMIKGCVPPRRWELNQTASWLNFHLKRDHQSLSKDLLQFCESAGCPPEKSAPEKTTET